MIYLQRATLAEKEVTTLKEQLSGNNASNNCENKDASNMDRQGFEIELSTKDKEVSKRIFSQFITVFPAIKKIRPIARLSP